MLHPTPVANPFRLRPAALRSEGGSSSMLRVARTTAVARAAPVLQARHAQRQLAFDFFPGTR